MIYAIMDGEAILLGKAGAGIFAVTIGVETSSSSHLRQAYTYLLCSVTFTSAGTIVSSLRTSTLISCKAPPQHEQTCSSSAKRYSIVSIGRFWTDSFL